MRHRVVPFRLRDIALGEAERMNEKTQNRGIERKAYEPPKVVSVSLRPEEAVLGHCKIVGHAGPVSGGCRAVVACKSQGS